jgi:hypothetical protein
MKRGAALAGLLAGLGVSTAVPGAVLGTAPEVVLAAAPTTEPATPATGSPALPAIQMVDPGSSPLAAANVAEQRGAEMYRYDQAAWHGTDQFFADVAAAGIDRATLSARGIAGYVVEPAEGTALAVTFYGEDEHGRWAFARYHYEGGVITGEGLVAGNVHQPLSPRASRMADARRLAVAEFRKPGHELCSSTPANTLVLPDSAGGLSVYLLTSTNEASVYPAGGHYRFDFDAAGHLVGERRFMKSCFPLTFAEKDGKRPEAVVLTHLLDPQPTEIHAFVSRNIPVPLVILTVSNRAMWVANKGQVGFIRMIPDRK